jgi:hypothetical protein
VGTGFPSGQTRSVCPEIMLKQKMERDDASKKSHRALERFQAKWRPVRVKKTRQIKNLEPRFDSIETEKALVTMAGANVGFGDTHMFHQTAKTDPSKVAHLNRE